MISFRKCRKRLQEDCLTSGNEDLIPIMVIYEPGELDELIEGSRRYVSAMLVLGDFEQPEE